MTDFKNGKDRYGRDFYNRNQKQSYNIVYWLLGLDGNSKKRSQVPITAIDDYDAQRQAEEYIDKLPTRRILIGVFKAPFTYILIGLLYLYFQMQPSNQEQQQTENVEQNEQKSI